MKTIGGNVTSRRATKSHGDAKYSLSDEKSSDLSLEKEDGGHKLSTSEKEDFSPGGNDENSLLSGLLEFADYLGSEGLNRIRSAYHFSYEAHRGQMRASGEPYISHPVAVAQMVCCWKLDSDSVVAALLHDVMEDSSVEKSILVESFGKEVADLVDSLSKLDEVKFTSREQHKAESFRKMLLAMARDTRVILIKLADRMHNMQTLGSVVPEKQKRVALETLQVYAPLANRLGLRDFFRKLTDLSFQYIYPKRYQTLHKAVKVAYASRREVFSKILESVQEELERLNLKHRVFMHRKSLFSIFSKMSLHRISFSQISDVSTFCIIVDTTIECYQALGALHSIFKPIPGRFRDYIAIPKINGYRSLHTALIGPLGTTVEFQIRTESMHRMAEFGASLHWLDCNKPGEVFDQKQEWLQSLLDAQSQTGDPLELMDCIKVDLSPRSAYVFTPQGEIIAIPIGATVIDFAYSLHTEIGNQAVCAKVNQKIVPLRSVLVDGDVVEVLTDQTSSANPNWLCFVKTGRARFAIKQHLKEQQYQESVEMGRRLLDCALVSLSVPLEAINKKILDQIGRELGSQNEEGLCADIGLGKRMATVVAWTIAMRHVASVKGERQVSLSFPIRPMPIQVDGSEQAIVTYCVCCYPLPGDSIVGHLRGGEGLFIHRSDCSVALSQLGKEAERWIEAGWSNKLARFFRAEIEVFVRNHRNTLCNVAKEIAESGGKVINMRMREEAKNSASLSLEVQVRDRNHLIRISDNLCRLSEISRITSNK